MVENVRAATVRACRCPSPASDSAGRWTAFLPPPTSSRTRGLCPRDSSAARNASASWLWQDSTVGEEALCRWRRKRRNHNEKKPIPRKRQTFKNCALRDRRPSQTFKNCALLPRSNGRGWSAQIEGFRSTASLYCPLLSSPLNIFFFALPQPERTKALCHPQIRKLANPQPTQRPAGPWGRS